MKASGISGKILTTATETLAQWENDGLPLDLLLDDLREENAPERPAVASLLFEYFRHKAFLDGLLARHAKHERIRQDMRLLIVCAAAQLFFQTGIARESAVNIAVDCAKEKRGPGGGGFVNAMLRSFLREAPFDPAILKPSLPEILLKRWKTVFGNTECTRLNALFSENPPLVFRLRDASVKELLESQGATPLPEMDFTGNFSFYEMDPPAPLFSGSVLEKGQIYIQDPAPAMAFSLLDAPPEGRLLDACAAPGGKTLMLAEIVRTVSAQLTVCDRSKKRLMRMNRNLRRAGIHYRSMEADAVNPPFSPESFDFILADVPCSNSGVFRRRPDAPWRFTEKRSAEIVLLQRDILHSLAKRVKKEGLLLYSTCSIEAEENSLQIQHFLAENPSFVLVRERLLTPDVHHDGAYAALLRKTGK